MDCFLRGARFDHSNSHTFEKIQLEPENFSSSCFKCGELAKSNLCTTCSDLSSEFDENLSRSFIGTSLSATEICHQLLNRFPSYPRISLLRFLVSVAACTSQARFEGNLDLSIRVGRVLQDLLSRCESSSKSELYALKAITFAERFLASSPDLDADFELFPNRSEVEKIALRVAQRVSDIDLMYTKSFHAEPANDVLIKPTKIRQQAPIPSWFGSDSLSSFHNWNLVAWNMDVYYLTDIKCVDYELAMNEDTALDPFQGWESYLNAAVMLYEAIYCKPALKKHQVSQPGQSPPNDALDAWKQIYFKCFSHVIGLKTNYRMRKLLRCLGSKESYVDLIKGAIFRSSLFDMKRLISFYDQESSDLEKKTASREISFQITSILNRLKKTIAMKNHLERWQRFCAEFDENPFCILFDVASFLFTLNLNPGIALSLVLKAFSNQTNEPEGVLLFPTGTGHHLHQMQQHHHHYYHHHQLKMNFNQMQLAKLFTWLTDSSSIHLRLYSLRILHHCFKEGNSNLQTWMEDKCARTAFQVQSSAKKVSKNVAGVESLLLFASTLKYFSKTRINFPELALQNVASIENSLGYLSRLMDSSILSSLSLVSGGLKDKKIATFSLLYSPPCLICNSNLDRPFHISNVEQVKSEVAFLSNTVVFRLSRLFDIKSICLDLQLQKRAPLNLIESIVCSVSKVMEDDLNLTTLALDDGSWERVCVLNQFDQQQHNSASLTPASSNIAIPFSGSKASSSQGGGSNFSIFNNGGGLSSSSHQSYGPKYQVVRNLSPLIATAMLVKFDFILSKDRMDYDRLLCPRCSKPVVSDHGVCQNCNEMVYQCKHCRNINYEDLKSFLCVQCGLCRHARFSFKLEARPSANYPEIKSEKECQIGREALIKVTREEAIAHEALDVARRSCLAYLTNMNFELFNQEIASSNLIDSFTTCYFLAYEAHNLRQRISDYRKQDGAIRVTSVPSKLSDTNEEDDPRRRCFVCDYAYCLATCVSLSALCQKPHVAEALQDKIDLLFDIKNVCSALNRVGMIKNSIPRSLSHLNEVTMDPLLALLFSAPNLILNEVSTKLRRNLELGIEIPGSNIGMDAVAFLETMALNAMHSQSVVNTVIELLSYPLSCLSELKKQHLISSSSSSLLWKAKLDYHQVNNLESLALACLTALTRITSHERKPLTTHSMKRHRSASVDELNQ